jgi:hypothetical protein
MNKSLTPVLALLALCAASAVAVPSGINYQGALTDDQGNPITGTRTMGIKLYDAATAGTLLYSEDIGTVDVSDGVFSFEFGTNGTSNAEQSDTVAITDGTATTFQKVLSAAQVVAGTVTVTDGTYTWSQSGGSSNEENFSVVYSTNLRRVTVTYLNGAPAAGRTITATYRMPASGISGAIAGDNQPWAEIIVDGVAQLPRQKVLTVPFSYYSLRTLETEKADPIARRDLVALQEAVAQTTGLRLSNIISSNNSIGSRLGVIQEKTDYNSTSGTLSAQNKLVTGIVVNAYWLLPRPVTGNATAVFRYTDSTFSQVTSSGVTDFSVANPNPSKPVASVEWSSTFNVGRVFVIGGALSSVTFWSPVTFPSKLFVAPVVYPTSLQTNYTDRSVAIALSDSNVVKGNWNEWLSIPSGAAVSSITVFGKPIAPLEPAGVETKILHSN